MLFGGANRKNSLGINAISDKKCGAQINQSNGFLAFVPSGAFSSSATTWQQQKRLFAVPEFAHMRKTAKKQTRRHTECFPYANNVVLIHRYNKLFLLRCEKGISRALITQKEFRLSGEKRRKHFSSQ